jgi:hypothetical protein
MFPSFRKKSLEGIKTARRERLKPPRKECHEPYPRNENVNRPKIFALAKYRVEIVIRSSPVILRGHFLHSGHIAFPAPYQQPMEPAAAVLRWLAARARPLQRPAFLPIKLVYDVWAHEGAYSCHAPI